MKTVLLVGALLLSLVSSELLLYSRNNLYQHPRWVVGKALASSGLMGWTEVKKTRNLFAGNRLNLDCWHGYQEILWFQPLRLGRLSCRVRLAEGARLHLQVERTSQGGQGFHLSRHPDFRSLVYRFNSAGEYIESLEIGATLSEGWHQLELRREGGKWLLLWDGEERALSLGPAQGEGLFCFRGNFQPVEIDNVRLEDSEGHLVESEDFRNGDSFFKVWAVLLVLLSLPTILALRGSRETQKRWGLSLFAMTALVAGLLLTDYHFWSHRYPYVGLVPGGHGMKESSLESFRGWLAGRVAWLDPGSGVAPAGIAAAAYLNHDPLLDDVEKLSVVTPERELLSLDDNLSSCNDLRQRMQPGDELVLLLGTSQSWGAGANRQRERVHWQLHHFLDRERTWLVNASRPGSNSDELLARYQSHLSELSPSLVIIWLGANDGANPAFGTNLERFLEINRERGIATLLVKEALALDGGYPEGGHLVMDEAVSKGGIPLLDLHNQVADHLNEGILYWDFVHLAPFGQRLAAKLMAQEIQHQGLLPAQSGSKR